MIILFKENKSLLKELKEAWKLEEKYTVKDEKLGNNSSQTYMYTYYKSSNYNDSPHLHKPREPYHKMQENGGKSEVLGSKECFRYRKWESTNYFKCMKLLQNEIDPKEENNTKWNGLKWLY